MIDAGLGRKELTLEEGKRAMQLLPVEKDAANGQAMQIYFAIIAAWVGEKDLTCTTWPWLVRRLAPKESKP